MEFDFQANEMDLNSWIAFTEMWSTAQNLTLSSAQYSQRANT